MASAIIDFLSTRSSAPIPDLREPAPTGQELETILRIASRVPDHGRLAPEGLAYVASWVDHALARCYQLMETEDRTLLDQWMARWSDLADFEVHPVMTSQEAVARIAPRL